VSDSKGSYKVSEEGEILIANPKLTTEGFEKLRETFEIWINEVIKREGDLQYTVALMIAHNFYKLIITDIAEKVEMPNDIKKGFYAQSLLRLSQALLEPNESRKMEKKIKQRR